MNDVYILHYIMTTKTIAKLFVKNFHEKLTCEDITNAIRGVDIGSVYSVQIRTSRRNVHHAIVEIVWDDTKSTSQFLRGLLNAGNTVCISLNSNRPNSYIEIVEYHEEIDTKHRRTYDELLVGSPKKFHRNIHGPPPQLSPIDEYEYDEVFSKYGDDILRSIGIY